jgi:hypothetical protein
MVSEAKTVVTIMLDKEEAEVLSFGLSDIACWMRGFTAACPDDISRHPMGIEAVRTLSTKIKSALDKMEKE